jgi:hypothetical protein
MIKLKVKTDEINFELEKEYEHSITEIKEIIAKVAEENLKIIKEKHDNKDGSIS